LLDDSHLFYLFGPYVIPCFLLTFDFFSIPLKYGLCTIIKQLVVFLLVIPVICGSVESRCDNTKLFVYKLQLYYEFGTHFDFVICSYCYLYSFLDQFFCWTVDEFVPVVLTF